MGGKNDGKDPFADFFGDDVDWLDDEEEAARVAAAKTLPPAPAPDLTPPPPPVAQTPPAPPVPPPPPPPLRPAADTFVAAPSAETAALDEPLPFVTAPAERSAIDDTVGVFLEPVAADETPAPAADPDALVTVTDEDPVRVVVPPDAEVADEVAAPTEEAPPPAPPPVEIVVEEDVRAPTDDIVVEEDAPDEIDVPERAAPAPTLVVDDAPVAPAPRPQPDLRESSEEIQVAAERVPAPPPEPPPAAPAPATPLETWSPQTDEGAWRELLAPIEALAEHTQDRGLAASLLVEAARIHRDRLGDDATAAALLERAVAAGASDPVVYALVAETATRRGDHVAAVAALTARAEGLEGQAAAEAWQAAALVARHRLREVEASEANLRRAVSADPTDYASLSLLRDHLSVKGREADRAEVLGRIRELASGRVAAEAWWELGRLQLALDDAEAARASFARGRACDPRQGQCFLALQALAAHLGDDVALGELYADEARRSEGPDAAHHWMEAARAFAEARVVDRADAAFEAAIAAGHPMARREQQAFFLATTRPAAYAGSLAAEIDALDATGGRAFALYRLGWVREHQLQDLTGAVAAYREAVALDPAAGPAAEAVARVLQASGSWEDLLDFWQVRVQGADDLVLRTSVLLRMAEVAAARLGDDARARMFLEQLVGLAPEDRTALDALRRIYRRLKAWPELATVYETLASTDEHTDARAQNLARAGNVWRYEVRDAERARDAYGRALALRPAHPIALDEQIDLLEELGAWSDQASVLRAGAEAIAADADKVRLAYRAGRVWLDRLDDAERAAESFRFCLRYQPGFLPALGMLKQLAARSNQGQEVYRLYLQQAQSLDDPAARHWRLLAAADLAEGLVGGDPGRDLGAILERDPAHPGALAAQELRLLALGAKVGLLNLYRRVVQGAAPGPWRTSLLVRIAGLYESLGDEAGIEGPITEAVETGGDGTPFRALGRIAEARRMWAVASRALERAGTPEDTLERARLLTIRLKQPDEALALYQTLLEEPAIAVGAALGAAALAQRAGDAALLYRAHATLAEHGGTDGVRAAHALWSGQLAEAAGDSAGALGHYQATLALRPASGAAFDGARRLLVRASDGEGLAALWRAVRPEDAHGAALDLEQVGAFSEAAQVLRAASDAAPGNLGLLAQLEVALERLEDWRGVYATATRRAALVDDAEARAVIDAKRRWLLAEKLYETDEAWTLYQALHEENPDDREVTSALARIALARGEIRLATGYLEHLAQGAATPAEAAALRVRVAEVHEAAGEVAEARQALLDALDHVSDHPEALAGLQRLARAEGDWAGLLHSLRLEAAHASPERRVEALREIARVTTEHLGDPAIAAEAWQTILEAAPADAEALRAALALAEQRSAWAEIVELAPRLAETEEGAERAALLTRAGLLALDELEQPAGAELLERALREGPPRLDAAERLLSLHQARGATDDVVRVLQVAATIGDDPQVKAGFLRRAAELRASAGLRDEAAELYEGVLGLLPEDRAALVFLAEYLFGRGQTEGALPVYRRLAPMIEEGQDLDDFDVRMELCTFFYRLARMLVDRGESGEAIGYGERALTYNPTHQPTLDLLAPLLIDAAQWGRAGQVLQQLLQLTGGLGDKQRTALTYARLGRVERAQGRANKARKHLEKALDLVPNHVAALQGLAGLHEDAQQWTQFLDVYNTVISSATQPGDVTAAYLAKGRVLDEQMARPDKAAQHFERSLAYDANQPGVLLRLAELAWRRGDFAEAAARAQLGLDLVFQASPLRADLHVCLAAARQALGDADRARQAFAAAQTDDPERALPDDALTDLEALRVIVRSRLPR